MGLIELSLFNKIKNKLNEIQGHGSPMGVYDTLSDLETADPDHGFVYIVKADNYWYYWDVVTASWTQGGMYTDSAQLDELAGEGRTTETVKGNADDIRKLDTPSRTPTLSQYAPVGLLGGDTYADSVVDGSLSIEQKGLTITNLVSNGNFASGFVAPWSEYAVGTPTVSNGVVSFTATAQYGRIEQSITNGYIAGHIIAVFAWVKSSSSLLELHSTDLVIGGASKYHTGGGGWELLVARYTVTESRSASIRLTDRRASGWTETQATKFQFVDLTDHGLDSITDTDILAKLLPYVDGTKNVGKMGVRVVGDNHFNKDTATPNSRLILNGTIAFSANPSVSVSDFIPVSPNDEWTIYHNYGGTSGSYGHIEYDEHKNFIKFTPIGLNTTVQTIITTAQTKYLRVTINLQIGRVNYGSSALPYEPYQEQLTFLPAVGNRLPNGVADSIKTVADGWEHTKRVERYVLQESDFGNLVTTLTNVDRININKPTDYLGYGNITESKNTYKIGTYKSDDFFAAEQDSTDNIGAVSSRVSNTVFCLYFAKGTYADPAAAQADLAGTVIYYQLATPVTTHIPMPGLSSVEGGSIQRFPGARKALLYDAGITFDDNVLSVISAYKFVDGEETDITEDATITDNLVEFTGVNPDDAVYIEVESDVDMPIGELQYDAPMNMASLSVNTAEQVRQINNDIEGLNTDIDMTNVRVNKTNDILTSVTTVATATYTLLSTDYIILSTYSATGAVAITLPTAQVSEGRRLLIKDAGGNASVNNITIDTEGAETIDGSATHVISADYGKVELFCDGTNWITI